MGLLSWMWTRPLWRERRADLPARISTVPSPTPPLSLYASMLNDITELSGVCELVLETLDKAVDRPLTHEEHTLLTGMARRVLNKTKGVA